MATTGYLQIAAAINTGDLVINGVPIPATVAGSGVGHGADSIRSLVTAIQSAAVPKLQIGYITAALSEEIRVAPNNHDPEYPSTESVAAGAIVINGVPIGAFSAAGGFPPDTIVSFLDSFWEAVNNGINDTSPDGFEAVLVNMDMPIYQYRIESNEGNDIILQETVPGSLAKVGLTAGTYKGQYLLKTYTDPGVPIVISGNHPEYAGLTAGTITPTENYAIGGYTTTTVPGTTTVVPETTVTIPGTTTVVAGDPSSDVLTQDNAQKMIEWADQKLQSVNGTRGYIGAMQNRFESVVSNLTNSSQNLAASRSRIMDSDFAAETAELTRNQIMQQAGTAMLAQANTLPQSVLSLLPK